MGFYIKIKKGYKDVTMLQTIVTNEEGFTNISDSTIDQLINRLQAYANKTIQENYLVGAKGVTRAQVEEAQTAIDALASYIGKNMSPVNILDVNKELIRLYGIIPRKMKHVKDHILDLSNKNYDHTKMSDRFNMIVGKEQDLLDVIHQQVELELAQTKPTEKKQTILDALGIQIKLSSAETYKKILAYAEQGGLKEMNAKVSKVYDVVHTKTESKYQTAIKKLRTQKTELLWHGSRNENWLNILKTGLLIHPANVVTTGSMFGNGIYFANKARKSLGYTSLSGSYWARGNDTSSWMALYEVAVGKQYEVHDSTQMDHKKIQSLGYDSLYAKAGRSLRNDELIVYASEQCTIRNLVEFENIK